MEVWTGAERGAGREGDGDDSSKSTIQFNVQTPLPGRWAPQSSESALDAVSARGDVTNSRGGQSRLGEAPAVANGGAPRHRTDVFTTPPPRLALPGISRAVVMTAGQHLVCA